MAQGRWTNPLSSIGFNAAEPNYRIHRYPQVNPLHMTKKQRNNQRHANNHYRGLYNFKPSHEPSRGLNAYRSPLGRNTLKRTRKNRKTRKSY